MVQAFYTSGSFFYGFAAFFNPIANEFGWRYAQRSLAAALRGAEVGLLAPLIGLFIDRLGPRRLAFVGAALLGLGLILLSRTTSLGMFYGYFAIVALGVSGLSPTVTMTVAANWSRGKVGIATRTMARGVALGGP